MGQLDWMFGRYLIEIPARWVPFLGQVEFVVPPSSYPRSWLFLLALIPDCSLNIFDGPEAYGGSQIQRHAALGKGMKMKVSIDESREDGAASAIDE